MSHGVHPLPSPPFCWGVEPHTKFSKEGELDRRGGVLLKKKKSRIFNEKKTTHMWRRWGSPRNFLLAFIDELWKNPKKKNFEKIKKNCWRYYHFTHVYQKPQSYEVQFLRYEVRQNFLSFWALFFPFQPLYSPPPPPPTPTPNNSENQNFKKLKNASGHNINLNFCNKKHDHMIYAYSD